MQARQYSLVADIGGTNARFALVAGAEPVPLEPRSLPVADYPTLVDAIRDYLRQTGLGEPVRAAISVASPVTGDRMKMTNHSWSFGVGETRASLGLAMLRVINDYTALALALPQLTPQQYRQVGPGARVDGYPLAVLGPGTGLGVSALVPAGAGWVPLESEGGHVTYGPVNAREAEIIAVLRERLEHVSAESLVSGGGLSRIYAAITRLGSGAGETLKPGEITELALRDNSAAAREALSVFCAVLGTVAGNLALTVGARGGIFIGGGILPRMVDFFAASQFRERFERHGRLSPYLAAIPTFIIDTPYPALTGAAVALDPRYDRVGVTSHAA